MAISQKEKNDATSCVADIKTIRNEFISISSFYVGTFYCDDSQWEIFLQLNQEKNMSTEGFQRYEFSFESKARTSGFQNILENGKIH